MLWTWICDTVNPPTPTAKRPQSPSPRREKEGIPKSDTTPNSWPTLWARSTRNANGLKLSRFSTRRIGRSHMVRGIAPKNHLRDRSPNGNRRRQQRLKNKPSQKWFNNKKCKYSKQQQPSNNSNPRFNFFRCSSVSTARTTAPRRIRGTTTPPRAASSAV